MHDRNPLPIAVAILAVLGVLLVAQSDKKPPKEKPLDCVDENCPLDQEFLESIRATSLPRGTHQGVVMELPPSLRTKNWGGGSCVHASTVSLLRWQGQEEMANWWRQQYRGGEYQSRLVSRMESANVRYAYTDNADMRFLEWCVRTRRGAGLFYKPSHAINLVGLDSQYAYLLDNNYTDYPERYGHYERVPRAEFERRWRGYGGFGWTLVYDPPPPTPYVAQR